MVTTSRYAPDGKPRAATWQGIREWCSVFGRFKQEWHGRSFKCQEKASRRAIVFQKYLPKVALAPSNFGKERR